MEQVSNKKVELHYDEVKVSKRIISSILDIIFLLLLSLILYSSYFFILHNSSYYENELNTINNILLESKLYVKDDDKILRIDEYLDSNKDNTYEYKINEIDNRLNYFYIDLNIYSKTSNIGKETLEKYKHDNPEIFIYDEESKEYEININASYSSIYSFYVKVLDESSGYFLNNETYRLTSSNLTNLEIVGIVSSYIISCLILYLIVPIFIFPRGNLTLAKLIFKYGSLGVNGMCLTKRRYLVKFLLSFFIENILSLVTFFIPLIVSFGMMVLSKTHQNFNEYITNTYSLSYENKKFYKDYNEYLYLTMKEKEN